MSTEEQRPGWRKVKFGDVVRQVKTTTKDPAADGIERVVGLEHLDRESLPLRRWNELADMPDGTSFTRIFRAGQVLFGKRRAYQRKVAVPDFDGVCSGDILVFEPSCDDLLPNFLPYLVQSDGFFDHALGTSAGSLSPRTKWQELAKYEFALPPLDEQQRIVELLERVNAAVDEYRCLEASARVVLCALRDEAFEQAQQEQGAGALGDFCEVIDCEHRTAPEGSGPWMVIGTPDVRQGRILRDNARRVDEDTFRQWTRRAVPRHGDLIFTREAPVGEVAQVMEQDLVCLGQRTVLLRPQGDVEAGWIFHLLQSPTVQRLVALRSAGTTTPHLNVSEIRALPLPKPSEDFLARQLQKLRSVQATLERARLAASAAQRLAVTVREDQIRGGDGVH